MPEILEPPLSLQIKNYDKSNMQVRNDADT